MKNLLTFFLLSSFLLMTNCQSSVTTADNTVLVDKSYKIPHSFSGSAEKKFSVTKKIDEIGAEVKFDIVSMEKDSVNSVLKNIKVTLNKGVKGYDFHANAAGEQINQNTKQNFQTYAQVAVTHYTADWKGKTTELKHFIVNSLGKVNEL